MADLSERELRAHERRRAELFPEEQPKQDRQATTYRLPIGGWTPCGGGQQRILEAGVAAE